MVKEADVSNLLRNYLNEKRYDCLEALYMLARGLRTSEIANALRARYGGAEGYQEVEKALKNLRLEYPSNEYTEDTSTRVRDLIEDFFHKHCLPIFIARLEEGLRSLSDNARKVLLIILRAEALKHSDEPLHLENVWFAYKIIFDHELAKIEKERIVNEFLEIGLFEYVHKNDHEMVAHFPPYIELIASNIEKIARLPKIKIVEEEFE